MSQFDSARKEFFATKKVGPYFSKLAELHASANEKDQRFLAREFATDARRLPADKFAECAKKYGFPISL